jgi:protein-tyrosine-phosphatase
MAHTVDWKPGQSILFVCYGNTCRSPMAEGLVRKLLGEKIRVESAGLAPAFEGPQPEAVAVMEDLFGVDISDYLTQDVFALSLEDYPWIIALDAHVYETLKARFPELGERLLRWDIDDPFGRPRRAYEQSARLIEYCINKFLLGNRGT